MVLELTVLIQAVSVTLVRPARGSGLGGRARRVPHAAGISPKSSTLRPPRNRYDAARLRRREASCECCLRACAHRSPLRGLERIRHPGSAAVAASLKARGRGASPGRPMFTATGVTRPSAAFLLTAKLLVQNPRPGPRSSLENQKASQLEMPLPFRDASIQIARASSTAAARR
jgi:hypothetical protein